MTSFIDKFAYEFERRRHFRGLFGWLLYLYNRAMRRPFGVWLPGRGKTVSVRLRALPQPVTVRLGRSDLLVVDEIFLRGEYDPLLRAGPKSVRTVVDLGANVGISVRLWQYVWPQAKIVAVEPDASNLEMCRRNGTIGRVPGNVVLLHACAAGRTRSVYLDQSQEEWMYRLSEQPRGDSRVVRAITMPQILAEAGLNGTVDVLKCDIEGAEAEVFADCSGWIDRVRYLIVELHRGYSPQRFQEDLMRGGGIFEVFCEQDKGNGVHLLFLRNCRLKDDAT